MIPRGMVFIAYVYVIIATLDRLPDRQAAHPAELPERAAWTASDRDALVRTFGTTRTTSRPSTAVSRWTPTGPVSDASPGVIPNTWAIVLPGV